jgi:hypothetical protein
MTAPFPAIPLALAALIRAAAPGPAEPVQSFRSFMTAVRAAQPAAFVGQPGFAVESAAAFAEMKAHVLELYRGVTVRKSFAGPEGQIVDCVPVDQQPGLRKPGRPRAEAGPDARPAAAAAAQLRGMVALSGGQRSDALNGAARVRDDGPCQAGTIPMGRVTLERIAAFRTLASFLAK